MLSLDVFAIVIPGFFWYGVCLHMAAGTPVTSRKAFPHLAVWATVLLWGLSFVSSKTILNSGVPPMTMVCLRFLLTTLVLNVILRIREPSTRLEKKNVISLALSGLFGVTIYFFFESRGIKLTSASHASLIIAVIPVLTLVAERLFYRTRISLVATAGIVLSVVGVYLVVRVPGSSLLSGSLAGDLFMFGACVAWVAYMMVSRDLHTRLSDLAITAYQSVFGTAFLIPLALLEWNQWVPITLAAGLNLLYLALFSSAVGNFLYMYALSRLGPVSVSPYVNLIPVVGVLGGVVLLGETITIVQLAGGIVIIVGLLLVGVRRAP
jgi:drug/metabolite transporter (DMT)-like permease